MRRLPSLPDVVLHAVRHTLTDPATGQVSTITGPANQSLSFTYEGSLLATTTWSGNVNGTVTHIYDDDFRIASEQVNAETPVVYTYDGDSLIDTVTQGPAVLDVQLDTTAPRILGTALGVVTDQYTYDPVFGEVATYHAEANGAPLLDISYTRDGLGRIHTKTESVQEGTPITYEYVYDAAGRLHQVKENGNLVSEYDYDLNGNRTGGFNPSQGLISGTYDEQDRLLEYTTTTRGLTEYTYAANGELATKTDLEGTTTYEYDANGNLRHVELPNRDLIDYVVDGQNRRVGKKVNGAWVQRFLYRDQLEPVAELDANGDVVSEFVYAANPHSPDFMRKNGDVYRIIKDHLGSVRFVVDVSSAAIVEQISYDEFGSLISFPSFQPFGFAGGSFDPDTTLTRFGRRDYVDLIGRWGAKDPLRFIGEDTNLYGYVLADPINRLDPSGLYGTNDCSFYLERCAESGGGYYCDIAPRYCNGFPKPPDPNPDRDDDDEGWARCTRQCLQDCDREIGRLRRGGEQSDCPLSPDPSTDEFWDPQNFGCHALCYTVCLVGLPSEPLP